MVSHPPLKLVTFFFSIGIPGMQMVKPMGFFWAFPYKPTRYIDINYHCILYYPIISRPSNYIYLIYHQLYYYILINTPESLSLLINDGTIPLTINIDRWNIQTYGQLGTLKIPMLLLYSLKPTINITQYIGRQNGLHWTYSRGLFQLIILLLIYPVKSYIPQYSHKRIDFHMLGCIVSSIFFRRYPRYPHLAAVGCSCCCLKPGRMILRYPHRNPWCAKNLWAREPPQSLLPLMFALAYFAAVNLSSKSTRPSSLSPSLCGQQAQSSVSIPETNQQTNP